MAIQIPFVVLETNSHTKQTNQTNQSIKHIDLDQSVKYTDNQTLDWTIGV